MAKGSKKGSKKHRAEFRFLPQSSQSPMLVKLLGGVGAMALGAGLWGQFYGHFEKPENQTFSPMSMVAIGGALLVAVAIWLGTSGDAALRVGDPGVALEKGELRRIPWHQLSKVQWDSGAMALVVEGKDESGASLEFRVFVKTQPQAAAYLASQAKLRAKKVTEIDDSVIEQLPEFDADAATRVALEAMQVVGKRCAKSGEIIGYEPDARVCTRCERVYHKTKVPKRCACGLDLTGLRAPAGTAEDEDEDDEAAQAAEA
jgi:hypothetical protein